MSLVLVMLQDSLTWQLIVDPHALSCSSPASATPPHTMPLLTYALRRAANYKMFAQAANFTFRKVVVLQTHTHTHFKRERETEIESERYRVSE